MSLIRKIMGSGFWGYALFGSWNVVFGVFMLLGFSTLVLPDVVFAVVNGVVPPYFLVVGVCLALIPLAAMILALTMLLRSPGRLFTLAYGVEWPLMFVLALRFFVLREAPPGVTLILSLAVLGMATLLWQILDKAIDTRATPLTAVRVAGLTVLLLLYGYSSIGIAFYALPLGAGIVRLTGEALYTLMRYGITFDWVSLLRSGLLALSFSLTGGVLLFLSASLFVLTPVAVPILAWRAWRRAFSALAGQIGRPPAIRMAVAVAALCIVAVLWTNQQSQGAAFALLKNPPATPVEAQALVRQEGMLRSGLTNSYLAPYRYISAVGEVRHIAELYETALGLSQPQAQAVESLYEIAVRPLLYEPASPPIAPVAAGAAATTRRVDGRALSQEPVQAAKLYQAYFDERIVDGEHATVANAVRSTWQGTQAEAALQDVEDRKVHLTRQEITTTEHGDWAEVEIFEGYQNATLQRQEVVYYFSLPESAVVTGVWLGNTPDREGRFVYHVAPRGAAQAVYRNEVRANLDPALLEQIGPRQYRLRIFPIAAKSWRSPQAGSRSATIQEGAPLYMWFTYCVVAQENAWPLPRLAEKRNVYWDATTTRVVNGTATAIELPEHEWLPKAVPASAPVARAPHRIEFASGESVAVRPLATAELPPLPANVRLAVVLDRSRSMRTVAAEVKATLARLAKIPGVDLYLTASPYRGEPPHRVRLAALDREGIDYAGGQTPGDLLAQYESLRAGAEYDAVIVVTDAAGYELGASTPFPAPSAPVWVVHLGSRLPLGYDDATLDAIQASGGSVTGDIDEALQRIAFGLTRGAGTTVDWVDGYTWEVTSQGAGGSTAATGDTAFAPLAARRLVLDAMYRERTTLHQVVTLDRLHAVALRHGIVTPFSSMLVLVTSQQEQLLKQLEDRNDRYEREVEQVGDTVGQNALQAIAVPEPHEWLLIGLAALMLAAYAIHTRRPDWNPLARYHGNTRLS